MIRYSVIPHTCYRAIQPRSSTTSAGTSQLIPTHHSSQSAQNCSECLNLCVLCLLEAVVLNLPALIQAARGAEVNSSAGPIDRDKDDSQMESVDC